MVVGLLLLVLPLIADAAAVDAQAGEKSANDKSQSASAKKSVPFCTAISKTTGNFYDLSKLSREKGVHESDFHIRGHDYGNNFTMNICAPVLAPPTDIMGVKEVSNVSAYYTTEKGEKFSIGEVAQPPAFRGRKLVLEYSDGSPCPKAQDLRKSSIITLVCDRELLTDIQLQFIAQVHECAYFFEARTPHACAKAGSQGGGADTLGPFGMFALIVFVMLSVYFLAVSRRRVPYVHAFVNAFFSLIRKVSGWGPEMVAQEKPTARSYQ
ncbi:mannose-6-phosphate receptor binding domain-containing protein [Myxozyma melibiosi]|uniref:Autophagy-related protein 27 n=1 Tax=Myxozyma melibiosi TaxID=54550 RepID=A0ABR1FED0_9ASCO